MTWRHGLFVLPVAVVRRALEEIIHRSMSRGRKAGNRSDRIDLIGQWGILATWRNAARIKG